MGGGNAHSLGHPMPSEIPVVHDASRYTVLLLHVTIMTVIPGMDEWVDGRVDGWTGGWMSGWME